MWPKHYELETVTETATATGVGGLCLSGGVIAIQMVGGLGPIRELGKRAHRGGDAVDSDYSLEQVAAVHQRPPVVARGYHQAQESECLVT